MLQIFNNVETLRHIATLLPRMHNTSHLTERNSFTKKNSTCIPICAIKPAYLTSWTQHYVGPGHVASSGVRPANLSKIQFCLAHQPVSAFAKAIPLEHYKLPSQWQPSFLKDNIAPF
jgi:hypothetical protein